MRGLVFERDNWRGYIGSRLGDEGDLRGPVDAVRASPYGRVLGGEVEGRERLTRPISVSVGSSMGRAGWERCD